MKLRPGPMDHEPENLKSCSLDFERTVQGQMIANHIKNF